MAVAFVIIYSRLLRSGSGRLYKAFKKEVKEFSCQNTKPVNRNLGN